MATASEAAAQELDKAVEDELVWTTQPRSSPQKIKTTPEGRERISDARQAVQAALVAVSSPVKKDEK